MANVVTESGLPFSTLARLSRGLGANQFFDPFDCERRFLQLRIQNITTLITFWGAHVLCRCCHRGRLTFCLLRALLRRDGCSHDDMPLFEPVCHATTPEHTFLHSRILSIKDAAVSATKNTTESPTTTTFFTFLQRSCLERLADVLLRGL